MAPHRLVIDFTGVVSAVPSVVPVAKGAVERVRVSNYSQKPQVTRVVVDLARPVAYTLQPSGSELKIAFAEGAAAASPAANTVAAAAVLKPVAPPLKSEPTPSGR